MIKVIWMLRCLLFSLFSKRWGVGSYIGPACYISGLKFFNIGRFVRIYPGARIEALGGEVNIGNNVSIGQSLHLVSSRRVTIGNNVTISANVFISDTAHSYQELDRHIINQRLEVNETVISDNCFIGYGAAILPGSNLGKQCIVGANAVVNGVFPDYSVIAGIPAKIIKRYDFESATWKRTDANGNFICEKLKV